MTSPPASSSAEGHGKRQDKEVIAMRIPTRIACAPSGTDRAKEIESFPDAEDHGAIRLRSFHLSRGAPGISHPVSSVPADLVDTAVVNTGAGGDPRGWRCVRPSNQRASSGNRACSASTNARALCNTAAASVTDGSSTSPGYRNIQAYFVNYPINEWLQCRIQFDRLLAQFSQIVGPGERLILPNQKALQCFLCCLLAVVQRIFRCWRLGG